MTEENDRKHLIAVARGDRPADLLLRNARLVDVCRGIVRQADIAVAGGCVAGLQPCRARREMDLRGRFVTPGFIDAHVHIESAMVTPAEFARAVIPRGTTAVVADPHEIANVLGTAGIDYMLAASADLPMGIYFTLPSCVPATAMETSGAALAAEDLAPYWAHPRVKGLAEVMNFPGVIAGDGRLLAKIDAARAAGKAVDGHAPGLSGRALSAYLAAGIGSDHECTTAAEALEKLSAGMHIMVREGSAARNLDDLLPIVDAHTAPRMMWCTDDRHPHDLLERGHISEIVRRAIQAGLDPVTAVRMATLNPARYFRLDDRGIVAPGRRADLLVFHSLQDPAPYQVYLAGELAAEAGVLREGAIAPYAGTAPAAMKVPVEALDFAIPARGRRVRVIEAAAGRIVTGASVAEACIVDGTAVADVSRDLLKVAVVERHHGSGRIGIGFVRGFGLSRGALASSVAHDSHNIVAVGADDPDLRLAVAAVAEMGGGLAVAAGGAVRARLPLPVAGLMSERPVHEVARGLENLLDAARDLGCGLPDPFMTLSFMALPVIPALKITDHGLVDVNAFEIVPLFD